MQGIDTRSLGKVLVTGGTGFIGAALTKRLVDEGVRVRVLDNNARGDTERLGPYLDRVEYIEGDVRDYDLVLEATGGIDTVFHLAFINGTENFYRFPGRVLDVGIRGALNTIDAAVSRGVRNYIVTSSSEVYQEPTRIPTPEDERIMIPDVKTPRFSYSGAKIITELLAIHYARRGSLRSVICRPHNFYGPDMGMGHVIPQFITRMLDLSGGCAEVDFPIQGTGEETRAFCYIDDAVEGMLICAVRGMDREIYHIGTEEEVSIAHLAEEIASLMGLKLRLKKGELLPGGARRRSPCISKLSALGYMPRVGLKEGLERTIAWYVENTEATGATVEREEGVAR